MNKQKGSGLIIILVIVALIAAVAAAAWNSYSTAYSFGNQIENQLKSLRSNNQNIYAQGTQAILEIAQVPTMYAADFEKIIKADIEGRYGKNGSSATVQFIQEHDIKIDPTLYRDITQQIQAFRAKFEVNQTTMIDVKRQYETALGNDLILSQGWWLKLAGYPKIDLTQFNPIITQRTEDVYKAGKEDGPLKLR